MGTTSTRARVDRSAKITRFRRSFRDTRIGLTERAAFSLLVTYFASLVEFFTKIMSEAMVIAVCVSRLEILEKRLDPLLERFHDFSLDLARGKGVDLRVTRKIINDGFQRFVASSRIRTNHVPLKFFAECLIKRMVKDSNLNRFAENTAPAVDLRFRLRLFLFLGAFPLFASACARLGMELAFWFQNAKIDFVGVCVTICVLRVGCFALLGIILLRFAGHAACFTLLGRFWFLFCWQKMKINWRNN